MNQITTTVCVLLFTAVSIVGLEIVHQAAGPNFVLGIIGPYMVLTGLALLKFLLYVDAE